MTFEAVTLGEVTKVVCSKKGSKLTSERWVCDMERLGEDSYQERRLRSGLRQRTAASAWCPERSAKSVQGDMKCVNC